MLRTSQRLFFASSGLNFFSSFDDGARAGDRVRVRIGRCDVDQVQQDARALQVLQEADAEASAFRGALDEARDVRHHEAALRSDRNHAQAADAGS